MPVIQQLARTDRHLRTCAVDCEPTRDRQSHETCHIRDVTCFTCSFGMSELKPNSITLASSEMAPNMFGASSELAPNQLA